MKKLGKILTLSIASLLLFACDDIVAEPNQAKNNDPIVNIDGKTDFYNNDFEVIFEKLTDSGTANETIMKQLINFIAKNEVSKCYGIEVSEFENVLSSVLTSLSSSSELTLTGNSKVLGDIILEQIQDKMIDKVKGGSYSTDYLFDEEEFVNELKTSLYDIKGESFNKDYLITPDSTYAEIFKADYSDYIEKTMIPDILKELLTSVYLYENEYTSLGRSYARDVQYIKLESISTHKDSVPVLINAYFDSYINNKADFPTDNFDLSSLARIYKGVFDNDDNTKEKDFRKDDFTSREEVLDEELEKVCVNPKGDDYTILTDDVKRDDDLLSSYTGSYKYPVKYGKELKDRELATMEIVVDDGIVVRSGGVSDLPTEMRDRLFSSGIASNYVELKKGTEEEAPSVKILTPKVSSSNDTDYVSKYAYYDSSTDAYYIVVVNDYYTTAKLRKDENGNTSEETKKAALKIARLLSTTSSNQKSAILHYLEEYGLEFGDQSFYDYIESTYPEYFED